MKKFLNEYKYVILTIVLIIVVAFITGCKNESGKGCYCVSTKVDSACSNGGSGLLCPEKPITFICSNQKGCVVNNENVQCAWYPLYCGWGEHAYCASNLGCFSPVCFGFDCGMVQCYDTGTEFNNNSEIDYRTPTEAIIGEDVIINSMKVYTDMSYLENAGITEDGFNFGLIDLPELLNDLVTNQANIYITVVVEFENKVELSGLSIEGIIYTQGTWKNEVSTIYKGNYPDANVNYRALNIEPGKHQVVFGFELDAIQKYLIDGQYKVTYDFRKYEE